MARLRDLAANPQLIGASLLEGLSLTTVTVFSTFVSIIVTRKFDLSAPHIALLISLQGVGYATTLIWGAAIAARINEFRLRPAFFQTHGPAAILWPVPALHVAVIALTFFRLSRSKQTGLIYPKPTERI